VALTVSLAGASEATSEARSVSHSPVSRCAQGYAVLTEAWTYPVHHAVGAYLATGDDLLVACRHTHLVCLRALTGESKWSASILNPWGWVAANDQMVFYLNQHSLLIALDRDRGELVWSRELRGTNGWLHAFGGTVVVGGWRGYTDIVALDAQSGRELWTREARGTQFHSTRIHAESRSLMIADPEEGGVLRFVRLTDGAELCQLGAPGGWTADFIERAPSAVGVGETDVLESPPNALFLIRGAHPTLERFETSQSIWSTGLRCVGGRVGMLSEKRELYCWSLASSQVARLGRVEHNRRDQLPFQFVRGLGYLFGSSFGRITLWSEDGDRRVSKRVGKRVSTSLSVHGSVLVLGTDSGQVVGLDLERDD
jgi:outer membrane protein assembly factor BamB